MSKCKNCVNYHNSDEWCMVIKDDPDPDLERECNGFMPIMPDELSPFARELITRCPMLINLFAEKINRMINNWHDGEVYHGEVLEPINPLTDTKETLHMVYTGDMQELISHVGYDAAQCGYEK